MTTNHPAPRAFMRHPAGIPIEIAAEASAAHESHLLKDVGLGGLAFVSETAFAPGAPVRVTIPFVRPPFETQGRVVWCHRSGNHYDIGVQFVAPEDAFAARMVEQVCHIEHYRIEVQRTEGRMLDGEAAAVEWIRKYAAGFPRAPSQ